MLSANHSCIKAIKAVMLVEAIKRTLILSKACRIATFQSLFTTCARTLQLMERKKVTATDLRVLKRRGKPITMITAYDYPSAVHVDLAGFDVLLVGDSLGMVELVMRSKALDSAFD